MNPEDFQLQQTHIPQPSLVDDEVATRDWPLPPVKPWAPAPKPSLFWQIVEALS